MTMMERIQRQMATAALAEHAPAGEAALIAKGVCVTYGGAGGARLKALEDAHAHILPGTMTAVIGPNGAGKSTFLKALLGLEPASGSVSIFGRPLEQARDLIAYVPQRATVDWDFPVRVIDVVLMGAYRRLGLLRRASPAVRKEAMDCLARLGLEALYARPIRALSGGQQQRVFLARALMSRAKLFLLDEPLAGVDALSEAAIIAVLQGLKAEGAAVLSVHHDLGSVPSYFDRVLLLNRSVVAEGPLASAFTSANLALAYGSALGLEALLPPVLCASAPAAQAMGAARTPGAAAL